MIIHSFIQITMEIKQNTSIVLFFIFCVFTSQLSYSDPGVVNGSQLRTYIVHLDPSTNIDYSDLEYGRWCMSFLPTTLDSTAATERMVHIYGDVIHGFAARLTEEEIADMEKKEGFISAYPDKTLQLHTTHTPKFLGLMNGDAGPLMVDGGKGVIVGVLDTGVTPDHPSFSDNGMDSPPITWKGSCDLPNGMCNKKLIGYRNFIERYTKIHVTGDDDGNVTIFDDVGHGTHTAGTIAGAAVHNANILGEANGTAMGMAPGAHLAIYRVCSQYYGCPSSSILAGMNAAIKDGVDVMSLSLGSGPGEKYDMDSIAVGSFRATQKGIFVSCSAGNEGPGYKTVANEAPWILTVGASTTDRRITSVVKLGNGQQFEGQTLYQPKNFDSEQMRPLVGSNYDVDDIVNKIVYCGSGIALCQREEINYLVTNGAIGVIQGSYREQGYQTFARNHSLPSSDLTFNKGEEIINYINSTDNPTAKILFKHTIFNASPSPSMAFFSSRGPSVANPGIMKPDIIGPGVDILASYLPFTDRRPEAESSNHSFYIMSGTSMSCPHLSGIVALIKSRHKDWSPFAIKSAIMTTADILDRDGKPITNEMYVPANQFAIGSGHVNARKAMKPGLVYDVASDDYISFICQMNYTDKQLMVITGRNVKCSEFKKISIKDVNYPSISVEIPRNAHDYKVAVKRTVTNVNPGNSTYSLKLNLPKGVSVTVKPQLLNFSKIGQKKSFTVTFVKKKHLGTNSHYSHGYLSWIANKLDTVVRIPMIVKYNDQ